MCSSSKCQGHKNRQWTQNSGCWVRIPGSQNSLKQKAAHYMANNVTSVGCKKYPRQRWLRSEDLLLFQWMTESKQNNHAVSVFLVISRSLSSRNNSLTETQILLHSEELNKPSHHIFRSICMNIFPIKRKVFTKKPCSIAKKAELCKYTKRGEEAFTVLDQRNAETSL